MRTHRGRLRKAAGVLTAHGLRRRLLLEGAPRLRHGVLRAPEPVLAREEVSADQRGCARGAEVAAVSGAVKWVQRRTAPAKGAALPVLLGLVAPVVERAEGVDHCRSLASESKGSEVRVGEVAGGRLVCELRRGTARGLMTFTGARPRSI